jgi:hypothetical protein
MLKVVVLNNPRSTHNDNGDDAMKFLCVECDEAMKLKETKGPDDGSMTVIFGCPKCGKDIAMLTNQMETQMVRSMDVKIGGRSAPAEPMSTVRTSLAQTRDGVFATGTNPDSAEQPTEDATESKCPFPGVVADAFADASEIIWTREAEERLERIPAFVRPMAKKGIERHAQEKGYTEIDDSVMDEVKDQFGM